VLVAATSRGDRLLRRLSVHHRNELRNSGPVLAQSLQRLISRTANSAQTASDRRRKVRG
jgi:hypothetical protein